MSSDEYRQAFDALLKIFGIKYFYFMAFDDAIYGKKADGSYVNFIALSPEPSWQIRYNGRCASEKKIVDIFLEAACEHDVYILDGASLEKKIQKGTNLEALLIFNDLLRQTVQL